MSEQQKSERVFKHDLQAGRNKVYGFDVREVSPGKKYVLITENRLFEIRPFRNSIMVFPDFIDEFCEVLDMIREKLK